MQLEMRVGNFVLRTLVMQKGSQPNWPQLSWLVNAGSSQWCQLQTRNPGTILEAGHNCEKTLGAKGEVAKRRESLVKARGAEQPRCP